MNGDKSLVVFHLIPKLFSEVKMYSFFYKALF